MTCSITITSISVVDPLIDPPTSLRVEGTSTQCGHINVSIICDAAGSPSEADVGTTAAGFWLLDVPIATNTLCLCGSVVTVHAECATDPTCFVDQLMTIQCGVDCPIITDVLATPSTTCNADGTRTVTFSASVTDTTGVVSVVYWEYEGGLVSAPDSVTSSGTKLIPGSFDYAPGTYTATLHTTYPEGCPDVEVQFVVDECPAICPDASSVTVTVGGCDVNGNRSVTLSFDPPLNGGIDFNNGISSPMSGLFGLTAVAQPYPPPGPYTTTVTPDGCPPFQVTVGPLDTCLPGVPTGACCLPTSQCVEMSQSQCSAAGGVYMGDGTSCSSTTCGGTAPPPPPPPSPPSNPPPGCALLLLIALILVLLGGVLVPIGTCLGIGPLVGLAVALVAIGLLSFLVWLLACAKTTACSVMQTVWCILFILEAGLLLVFAIIVAIFGALPCLASVLVPALVWGLMFAWLTFYMGKIKCPTAC